jgi:Zn-dependent protease/CBS domain-containing protein
MAGSLRLGKILGIEIRIHYSWFLIFAVVSFFIYKDFQDWGYGFGASLLMGLAASLVLFACIVAHELAHSLVAMRNGIPVRSITLFILGGVANISREAERPKTEILMAVAGPACSLVLGLVFGVAWLAAGGYRQEATPFHDLLVWLAWLNLVLGMFNLLPGFPMDGGRVLRAIIWQITKNYRKATRIASIAGQVLGWVIAGAGVAVAVSYLVQGPVTSEVIWDAIFDGGYLVLLGWYLSSIAAGSYRQVAWREAMRGVTAGSAMVSDFRTISPDMSLMQVVRDYIQPAKQRGFVVAAEGRFLGVVDVDNIRRVSRDRWDTTPVGLVMTPADKVMTVGPEEDGINVAEKMEEHRLDGIPVVRDGVVLGIVTRYSLARMMELRAQFSS